MLGLARPGDDLQQPTLQFSYHDQAQPFRIEASQRILGSQYAVTRRYYDGLGRLVQSQSLLNGQALVTDQRYTAHGELLSQSMPYSQSDTGGYLTPPAGQAANQFEYDALGRLVRSTAPDGSSNQTDYGLPLTASGLRQVQTLDAQDRASTSWLDACCKPSAAQP